MKSCGLSNEIVHGVQRIILLKHSIHERLFGYELQDKNNIFSRVLIDSRL